MFDGLSTDSSNLWADDLDSFVGSEIKCWAELVKGAEAKLDRT